MTNVNKFTSLVTRVLLVLAASLMVALQFLDPGIGPLEKPMSSYALGAYAAWWTIAVIGAGIATLLLAVQWRERHRGAIWWRVLLMTGVALLFVAAFSTDPWYPWQHALTWTGWVHVIATAAGMGGIAASMLVEFSTPDGGERSRIALATRGVARSYLFALVSVGIATLVFLMIGRDPLLIGLEERVLTVLALSWLALRAFYERSVTR